jgi:arylsulfatase A-like enzyme
MLPPLSTRPALWALLFASWLVAGLTPLALHGADADGKPNIVFIMADDLGYGDLGCYGQKRIQTPHIDRLAKEGLRFTDFYAGCTVCAPSRCVLMTGLHTGHAHIRGNAGKERPEIQILRDSDVTVAEVLKKAGYATALCGKWGLGDEGSIGTPNKQGFDYFFGYLNQFHAHNYYPAYLFQNESRYPLKNVVPGEGPFGTGVATTRVEYSADLITAEALKWVEQNKDQPFFLYYSPTLPHANNEGGKNGMEVPDLGKYASTDWPPQQKAHAAMISWLDADVGRLMGLLKKLGLDDNTLVFFSSDNGPHREGGNDPDFNDSNGPLAGIKRDLTEGGIRVPFIARWRGQIAAGVSDYVGGFQDLMPTLAELAGVASDVPKHCDGLSIVPTLWGEVARQKPHDYLYWTFYERGGGQAARIGPWKGVQQPLDSALRLYDLGSDIGEQRDVAAQHPEVVAKLITTMKAAYTPHENWKFPDPGQPAAGKGKAVQKAKVAPR